MKKNKKLTFFGKLWYSRPVRRTYPVRLSINRRLIKKVVIDPHFEERHSESIDDEIILSLVMALDGQELDPDAVNDDGFQYFATEPLFFEGKPYRLIWLLPPDGKYLGVVNCFRRPHGKVSK